MKRNNNTVTASDKPALEAPTLGYDPDWLEKIEIARRAREDGKKLRKGKPITFQTSRLSSSATDTIPETAATPVRSPLYEAHNAPRYERQELIREYQKKYQCRLVVVADIIFPESVALFEETLHDADPSQDLHVMLATLGGDGETAIRLIRQAQCRCRELTVIVPDAAKSAGTLFVLGAGRTADRRYTKPWHHYFRQGCQRIRFARQGGRGPLRRTVAGDLAPVDKIPGAWRRSNLRRTKRVGYCVAHNRCLRRRLRHQASSSFSCFSRRERIFRKS